MDCITTQGLISHALDRAPIDAIALTEAKAHCQNCPTCSVFVRTLLLVKNSRLPEPPADFVDRVMVAVRAEAVLAEQRAAAAARAEAATAASAAVGAGAGDSAGFGSGFPATPPDPSLPASSPALGAQRGVGAAIVSLRRWARTLSRRELATWASAAVLFVAAFGIAAAAGIRVLTTRPASVAEKTVATGTREYGGQTQLSAPAPESADVGNGSPTAGAAPGSVITVGGVVFAASGPSTIATESLHPAGSAVSALGSGAASDVHAVLAGDDPNRVYLADDTNRQLLAFDRVVRTYDNVIYQLTSADVSAFGQWPTLPAQIPAPASDDGSPTFIALTEEPSGTRVFRLASAGAETGIAVAPGTSPEDPAAGNPNWTWWTPAR